MHPGKICGSLLLMLLFLSAGIKSWAQPTVTSPCDANPFCSDSSYTFPNTSGNIFSAPPSPPVDYGVVSTQPNPVWYWMQIGTSGTIQITINQTNAGGAGTDVDFTMWGPFTDLASGCAAILAGTASIQSSYDGGGVTEIAGLGLPGGSQVGQGNPPFPPGGTTPPAAVAGEVYILMLTNYANSPGTISFSQTAGTGSADCGIVCGLTAENSGPKCFGNPITLTAINSDTATAFTYYWSGPNGFAAGGRVVTFNPTAPGNFTFNVMAVSDENDTCKASTDVVVHPLPSVTLANPNDRILCNIDSTTLALNNPSAGIHYQWFRDGVALPNDTNASLVVRVNGTYHVTAVSPEGCTDTSEDILVKLSFTDVDFNFTIMKGCTEDTVQFNNLSEPGNYWWSFGDGTTPEDTLASPLHIYQDQDNYVVRLKMKDMDGCVDSVVKFVDVQHPLHAAFSAGIDSVCQANGTPIPFTDASVGATGWNWDFGDGATATQQHPTHTYTQAGGHTVRLIINDNLPCYDTAYHQVYVDSLPFLEFVTDKHSICVGDRVSFTPSFLYTAQELSWDFGDGMHWKENGPTSHSFDQPGTYWVKLLATFPVCAEIMKTDSVVVHALPVVNLGPDSVLCLDGPAIRVGDANNAADPTIHWMWSTGATTPYIEIVHPGEYSVTASRGDCGTTERIVVNKDCYTDMPNAFTPNGDGNNDYFYPRQLLSKGVVSFSMTVVNRWGQKVFETTSINGRGWDGKFNEKDQPMGVYIYQIKAVLKNGRTEEYNGNVTLVR
ncbi:gliding motility-associated C-terminal domain-containing protein [Taibaiella helva]|uniref:gliding motility-associated C-terminal domain-containing protein n=1 Tax=Taibaiella helva TaxID=2301235 RepID=UPI0018E52790|nr:gliding motility-associated C-terminal domain-containing protein [Taibaiella helva]